MAELQQELNYLTINTDASFHPKRKTSGYAYYIRCNLFIIKKGGNFKARKPKTSLEAEVMCIGNALSTVLSRELPKIKIVVINTDCKGGIKHIKEKSGFIYERIRTLERLLHIS